MISIIVLYKYLYLYNPTYTHFLKETQKNNPLHGITLEAILLHLVDYYGWDLLGRTIDIKCFNVNPSIKSSLTFLRKTPWARKKVEDLYIESLEQ